MFNETLKGKYAFKWNKEISFDKLRIVWIYLIISKQFVWVKVYIFLQCIHNNIEELDYNNP